MIAFPVGPGVQAGGSELLTRLSLSVEGFDIVCSADINVHPEALWVDNAVGEEGGSSKSWCLEQNLAQELIDLSGVDEPGDSNPIRVDDAFGENLELLQASLVNSGDDTDQLFQVFFIEATKAKLSQEGFFYGFLSFGFFLAHNFSSLGFGKAIADLRVTFTRNTFFSGQLLWLPDTISQVENKHNSFFDSTTSLVGEYVKYNKNQLDMCFYWIGNLGGKPTESIT